VFSFFCVNVCHLKNSFVDAVSSLSKLFMCLSVLCGNYYPYSNSVAFDIASWNLYGSKMCSKARTSSKIAVLWCTAGHGWWFNISDCTVVV